jgi:YD repeat-containing protein
MFVASLASAQSLSVFSATGTQPARDAFSQLPFERIVTATGSVVLTFSDLALPGDGGSELRFVRSFNTKDGNWTFGIAGVVMRVADQWPPAQGSSEFPILYSGDGGGQVAATQVNPGSNVESFRVVMTDRFWRYDRALRLLATPDGAMSQYDSQGRLIVRTDSFGNTIRISGWGTTSISVTQGIVGGPSRVVAIALPDASCWLGKAECTPRSMEYDGRRWDYATLGWPDTRLTTVTLPQGPSWRYAYPSDEQVGSIEVTTPSGGRVHYQVNGVDFEFYEPRTIFTNRVLKYRRLYDRGASTPVTWEFQYAFDGQAKIETTSVLAPDGTITTLKYGQPAGGPSTNPALAAYAGAAFVLQSRSVSSGGSTLESETRSYVWVGMMPNGGALPEPATESIIRGGVTYLTELAYSASNYGDYHHPNDVKESSQGRTRRALRTYMHVASDPFALPYAPYFLAKLKTDSATVTVNGTTFPAFSRSWDYNASTGFLERETIAGLTTTYVSDGRGNRKSVANPKGTLTGFEYMNGGVSKITTSAHVTTIEMNPDGTVYKQTIGYGSANARTTTYAYDGLSRVTGVQLPGQSFATITDYDDQNGTWIHTLRGSAELTTTLDGFGRPIATLNGVGVKTATTYDGLGRVQFQSLPFTGSSGPGTKYDYDGLGRVTKETNTGDNSFRQYTYGAGTVDVGDENDRHTIVTRVAFGSPGEAQIAAIRDALGKTWSYSYDSAGHLREVAGPDGVKRTWTFNANHLLESETHPESGTATYTYQGGLLATRKDAAGRVFSYSYDGNDRLKQIDTAGSVTRFDYEAGSDNRRSTSVDAQSSLFTYDAVGRLKARSDTVDGKTFDTVYDYDPSGNLERITYPSGRHVKVAFDRENRVASVFNPDTSQFYARDFQYSHPSGALTHFRAGNQRETTLTYDANRYWVRSIATGTGAAMLGLTYSQYDKVGNVQQIADARGTSQTFTYDNVDRLATAIGPWGTVSYTYDAHGNPLKAGSVTYTYDTANRFRLKSDGSFTLGYDPNGNVISGPQTTYTYTPENRLATAKVGPSTIRFAYDADDWRVKKAIDKGETHYYVRGPNGELLSDWWNNATATQAEVRDYIYAGSRVLAVVKTTRTPK